MTVAELPQIDAALADAVSGSTLEITATSVILDGRALERLPRRGHIIMPLSEALADGGVKAVEIVAAPDLTMDVVVDVLATLALGRVLGSLRAASTHGGDVVPIVVPNRIRGAGIHEIAVHVQRDRTTVHDGGRVESFPCGDIESVATRVQAAAALGEDKALPTHVTVSFEDDAELAAVAGAVVAARGLDCRSSLPCQVRGITLLMGHSWGGTRVVRPPETKECAAPSDSSKPSPLDRDAIRKVVLCHVDEVRYCYEQGLLRNSALAGRVTIQFNISPEGTVAGAVVADSDVADRNVGNCIAKAVKRWRFPKPAKGSTVVSYPFVLNPRTSDVGEWPEPSD